MENKKVLYSIVATAVLVVILGVGFIMSKTKGKNLALTINKVYLAYSSYLIDLGTAPESIKDLYENQKNVAKWNGPYISKAILNNYTDGDIQLIHASNIPTKACSLDYISYCYKWIKITNLSSSDFSKIKSETSNENNMFFANDSLYFKLSIAE